MIKKDGNENNKNKHKDGCPFGVRMKVTKLLRMLNGKLMEGNGSRFPHSTTKINLFLKLYLQVHCVSNCIFSHIRELTL
jgi:hypothetical protein